MNEQLLKTSGADVLSTRKKSEKPYGGRVVFTPTPHPLSLYVRGLIYSGTKFFAHWKLRLLDFLIDFVLNFILYLGLFFLQHI